MSVFSEVRGQEQKTSRRNFVMLGQASLGIIISCKLFRFQTPMIEKPVRIQRSSGWKIRNFCLKRMNHLFGEDGSSGWKFIGVSQIPMDGAHQGFVIFWKLSRYYSISFVVTCFFLFENYTGVDPKRTSWQLRDPTDTMVTNPTWAGEGT